MATDTPNAQPQAQQGYTYADIGARMKSRDPRLANFSDDEVGKRMAGRDPRIASMISGAAAPASVAQTPPELAPPADDTALTGVVKGAGKSVLDTVKGTSSLGERVLGSALKTLLPKSLEPAFGMDKAPTLGIFKKSNDAKTSAEKLQATAEQGLGLNEGDLTEARGTAQQVGKIGGDIAQFFIPGGAATKAGKALETVAAARKLGKVAQFGSRVLPGAITDLAISEAQTGGKDHGQALLNAAGAVVGEAALSKGGQMVKEALPGVFGKADDAARSVFGRSKQMQAQASEAAATKAVKTGIDQNVVDFVRSSTPEDKAMYRKMFDMAETGSKDLRFREQPKQLAGKTILDHADHLVRVKDQGVQQTKRVIDTLGSSKQDASGVLQQFLKDMDDKGITVVRRGNGVQLIPNKGSKIVEEDLPFYQSMLRKLMPDQTGKVQMSYRDMHGLRQYIFEKLSLAKSRNQPFSDDLTRYGEQLRRYLAEPINTASKGKYMAAQQRTAESMGALRDFVQLVGYKGNLENLATKDLKVGEVASRIFGNAADRPMSVLQTLTEAAQKYGYKPNGNYIDQLQFADMLESYFGTKQTRSLRGQVAKAGVDTFNEVAGTTADAATGNWFGLFKRGANYILKQRDVDQVKALKELLDAETKGMKKASVFGKKKAAK